MTIEQKKQDFIYLADQHGIAIEIIDDNDDGFIYEAESRAEWNDDLTEQQLLSKCTDLAKSLGLKADGNECYLEIVKQDKK